MTWLVVNRETGVVVSRWLEPGEAVEDKQRRDAMYAYVEPVSLLDVLYEAVGDSDEEGAR